MPTEACHGVTFTFTYHRVFLEYPDLEVFMGTICNMNGVVRVAFRILLSDHVKRLTLKWMFRRRGRKGVEWIELTLNYFLWRDSISPTFGLYCRRGSAWNKQ